MGFLRALLPVALAGMSAQAFVIITGVATGWKSFADFIAAAKANPGDMTIPEFTEYVRKEVEETQKVLKAAGIKPQ